MIGGTLGHYRIDSQLGQGGMGVVYRATDTHLNRPVAIKVLAADAVANPDRKKRFVQEAHAASALNHPNIVHIYDIDQAEGVDFIAMEYVAGANLSDRLSGGRLPLAEALHYGTQMADALARAHAAGIVHRDMKPANVMIAQGGLVKVLDFGLAKLAEPAEPGPDAPTQSLLTEEGAVIGTAAYMSPEQAAGKKVDARSDIFSLGSVLYEMVTGRRAFQRETKMSTLGAIMHEEPALASQVTEGIPPELERIILRCLRKEPERRIQTMADLKVALEELREETKSGRVAVGPAAPVRRWGALAVATAVFAIVAAAVIYFLRRDGVRPDPTLIKPLTSFEGWESSPSWSPDGTLMAYHHNREGSTMDIFVIPTSGGDPVQLTKGPVDEVSPRWSPDGRYLAFAADRGSGAHIYLIPPLGGAERKLAETGIPGLERFADMVRSLGPTPWSPDGQELLYSRLQPSGEMSVWKLHVATGNQSQVTFPPRGGSDLAASWSFDGEQIAFHRNDKGVEGLWLVPARGGAPRPLVTDGSLVFSQPAWSADSRRILFISNRAGPLNLWDIEVASGRSRQITTGPSWDMYPVAARDGRVAYVAFGHQVDLYALDVESGTEERVTSHSRENMFPSFSPDGRRMVYQSDRTGNNEIWLLDLAAKTERNLTNHPGDDLVPDWSPDGREIAFLSSREGKRQVWIMDTEGGSLRRLADQTVPDYRSWMAGKVAPRWSPDGKSIGYIAASDRGDQLWVADREGRNAKPRLDGVQYFDWYVDSRRVIYVRPVAGATEIRAADLDTGEETVLLKESALELALRPDGRGVIYSHAQSHFNMNLFLLPLELPRGAVGLPRAAGSPRRLTNGRAQWHVHQSAWSPDGKAVVYTRDTDQGDIYMIENYR